MRSGSSRFETRWWEAEAQRKVVTTKNTGKFLVWMKSRWSAQERSGLDTLFALHCRHQHLSGDQRVDPPALTVDFKANELWRLFRMPPGCGEAPWDWNWYPPLEGIPSEIAAEFHATVCQAIFRIPFSDFVKCALGYSTKAHFHNSLVNAVCDVRDNVVQKLGVSLLLRFRILINPVAVTEFEVGCEGELWRRSCRYVGEK
ncbi:hypothetical protein DL98DRAFT_171033 [Cadophora sp. DSE1049]|nr:hypothetical protein DL98DRAFT_171033 [Cadophora sp. DSE1049]